MSIKLFSTSTSNHYDGTHVQQMIDCAVTRCESNVPSELIEEYRLIASSNCAELVDERDDQVDHVRLSPMAFRGACVQALREVMSHQTT